MELAIHFVRARDAAKENNRLCDMYGERLLDLFGTVSAAHAARDNWRRQNEPPIHPWTTYNRISFLSATTSLTPSERANARFIVEFI